MKVWLLRALVASAIGAYMYYNRKLTVGAQLRPVADDTVGRVGTTAAP
jgi:hypothetical protein